MDSQGENEVNGRKGVRASSMQREKGAKPSRVNISLSLEQRSRTKNSDR